MNHFHVIPSGVIARHNCYHFDLESQRQLILSELWKEIQRIESDEKLVKEVERLVRDYEEVSSKKWKKINAPVRKSSFISFQEKTDYYRSKGQNRFYLTNCLVRNQEGNLVENYTFSKKS
jgi:hypothetical protein